MEGNKEILDEIIDYFETEKLYLDRLYDSKTDKLSRDFNEFISSMALLVSILIGALVIARSYLLSSVVILLGLGCIMGIVYFAHYNKSKEEEKALDKYSKKIGSLLTILMYLRYIKFLDPKPDLTPMVKGIKERYAVFSRTDNPEVFEKDVEEWLHKSVYTIAQVLDNYYNQYPED